MTDALSRPDAHTRDPSRESDAVLVVDDDARLLQATVRILEKSGYRTLAGASAAEAIDLARRHRPALVLLDVMLPDGDGMEVARRLKCDPALPGVMVVLLSGARITPRDQAEGLAQGLADGYITRPFNTGEFLARVEACLRIRAAQESLRQSERKYRLLAETARDFILVHRMDGRITYVNPMLTSIGGYREDELLNHDVAEFVPPERVAEMARRHEQRSAGDTGQFLYEAEFVDKAGLRIPVEIASSPIVEDGAITGILAVARDITDRKRHEEEMARKNAELKRFAYAVSHDLKSPLVTVRIFLGCLDQDLARGDSERVARDLQHMRAAAEK